MLTGVNVLKEESLLLFLMGINSTKATFVTQVLLFIFTFWGNREHQNQLMGKYPERCKVEAAADFIPAQDGDLFMQLVSSFVFFFFKNLLNVQFVIEKIIQILHESWWFF